MYSRAIASQILQSERDFLGVTVRQRFAWRTVGARTVVTSGGLIEGEVWQCSVVRPGVMAALWPCLAYLPFGTAHIANLLLSSALGPRQIIRASKSVLRALAIMASKKDMKRSDLGTSTTCRQDISKPHRAERASGAVRHNVTCLANTSPQLYHMQSRQPRLTMTCRVNMPSARSGGFLGLTHPRHDGEHSAHGGCKYYSHVALCCTTDTMSQIFTRNKYDALSKGRTRKLADSTCSI